MSKLKKQFVCGNCGNATLKWSGKCSECGVWGMVNEEILDLRKRDDNETQIIGKILETEKIDSNITEIKRIETKYSEFNRILGGGFVPSSVCLIGGDPGIGKSTILLQLTASLSKQGINCLYVTGEESSDQVKLRAKRLDIRDYKAEILAATNINDIIATIDDRKDFNFVVIDSIQTVYNNNFSSTPGSVSQIKNCTQQLIDYAKRNNIIMVIVGHVTKEGELAGPKILEHMVDTVLYFEGENSNNYRILRAVKNRFGSVNEIGVFDMTSEGLQEITNPSELFLMHRENSVSGTAVFCGIEGSRPILVEVQSLIAHSNLPMPKRSAVGWDQNRLSMILAVLSVRYGVNLSSKEIYLSIAGGLKISDPAIDLAVCASLISAAMNKPLPKNSVFFGEIGLSGEVRNIRQSELRIKESLKQGYEKIYLPKKHESFKENLYEIKHIKQLKSILEN